MSEPERYVRYRQASRERAAKAKLALDRYEVDVREGLRQVNVGERLRLRLAHTEATTPSSSQTMPERFEPAHNE